MSVLLYCFILSCVFATYDYMFLCEFREFSMIVNCQQAATTKEVCVNVSLHACTVCCMYAVM